MFEEEGVSELRERIERVEELLKSFVFQREKSKQIVLKAGEVEIVNKQGQRRVHIAESANCKGGNIRLYDRGGNIQIGLGADNDNGGILAIFSPDGKMRARVNVDCHANGEIEVCGPDGATWMGVNHHSREGLISFSGPLPGGW